MAYQHLADAVLALHFSLVLFVVVGLLLILLGNFLHWQWVNALWFRASNLLAIAVVVAEAWLGIVCPLTALENWLRVQAAQSIYRDSFIEQWVSKWLFYDAPTWVFTLAYSVFGLMVALAWLKFPPRK